MKTKYTNTHILSAAFLTALALTPGCMKSVPYEVRDGEAPQKVESPAQGNAVETTTAYIVEGIHDDPLAQNAVREISILKPQTMVVSLAALKPGKEYSVHFFCYDAKGKEAHRTQKPYVFTPNGSKWSTWFGGSSTFSVE